MFLVQVKKNNTPLANQGECHATPDDSDFNLCLRVEMFTDPILFLEDR